MLYKIEITPENRKSVLNENRDKILIEEQNLFSGNFLIFSDELPVTLESLKQQIQDDNLVKLEVLATIFEELMMIGSV